MDEISDIICALCFDTLTSPVTLACSHTFCSACISPWLKSSIASSLKTISTCPTCRAQVPRVLPPTNRVLVSAITAVTSATIAATTANASVEEADKRVAIAEKEAAQSRASAEALRVLVSKIAMDDMSVTEAQKRAATAEKETAAAKVKETQSRASAEALRRELVYLREQAVAPFLRARAAEAAELNPHVVVPAAHSQLAPPAPTQTYHGGGGGVEVATTGGASGVTGQRRKRGRGGGRSRSVSADRVPVQRQSLRQASQQEARPIDWRQFFTYY